MNIALMNERIELQKASVITDDIGNRRNEWVPYYNCVCTVGGEYGIETEKAATTVEHTDISFTVRSCSLSDEVTPEGYRILFHDEVYNIVSVDHMNYKHKCLKFRCRKERT